MITLLNNAQVDELDIRFDPNSYHFHLQSTGADITNALRRADKLALVPDFDVERENIRISRESGSGGRYGNDELSESTWDALGNQVTHDGVLAAPLETLDNTVRQVFKSTGVQSFIVLGALGLGAYIFFNSRR